MKELPLTQKYKPNDLEEILGNETVIQSLINAKNNLPNLLLYGPPGTGKTTSIKLIANNLYGKSYKQNVLELNASDERGINVVREKIKTFSNSISFNQKKKLIILDEADSMSKDAQNALRRIMEDFSGNVRFCLIGNYANKIIPPIQSRCCKFRFLPVKSELILKRIIEICKLEGIAILEDTPNDISKVERVTCENKENVQVLSEMSVSERSTGVELSQSLKSEDVKNDGKKGIYTLTDLKNLIRSSNGDMRTLLNSLDTLRTEQFNLGSSIHPVEFLRRVKQSKVNGVAYVLDVLKETDYVSLLDFLTEHIIQQYYDNLGSEKDEKNSRKDNIPLLLNKIADIEYRIAQGCNETVQMKCLVGIVREFIE